jgi:hypothetical protein
MAQTAVEWLFKALWEEPKDKLTWYSILDKAKEMEKEQIIEAHDAAYIAMNLAFRGFDRSVEYYENNYGENRGSNQSITGKD